MPGYYSSRPQRPVLSELPPTPPGSGSGFGYSSMPYASDPYAPAHNLNQIHADAAYDFQHGYIQPTVAPATSTYTYPQNNYSNANSLPPIQTSFYEPMAPILPPLRMHELSTQYPSHDVSRSYATDPQSIVAREQQIQQQQQQQQQTHSHQQKQQHQQTQPSQKEEKPSGGVSAKLDYDMERMTDFVTEATQSIFRHGAMHPGFRKWIHQVLSATRLPSATILLSLHYLNDRVETHPQTVNRNDENHFYRLLAVSLILGSKFLDDNTFINRSWSDVTSIKVAELNMLEMKWLHLINYQLHVDPAAGLNGWIDAWKKYDGEYTVKQQRQQQQQQMQATRLSPLNTNLRHHASSQELRFSPYATTPSSVSGRTYASATSARSAHSFAAYGNNDLWATSTQRQNMDDYYNRHAAYPSYAELESVARRASEERARQSAFAYPQSAHSSYYSATSPYVSAWDQGAWASAHRFDCGCSSCAYQQHYRAYPMASSYASQPVVG